MPKFRASFYWWMATEIEVEADTEKGAKAKALELAKAINTDTDGEYVADSFELGCIDLVDDEAQT